MRVKTNNKSLFFKRFISPSPSRAFFPSRALFFTRWPFGVYWLVFLRVSSSRAPGCNGGGRTARRTSADRQRLDAGGCHAVERSNLWLVLFLCCSETLFARVISELRVALSFETGSRRFAKRIGKTNRSERNGRPINSSWWALLSLWSPVERCQIATRECNNSDTVVNHSSFVRRRNLDCE